MVRSWQERAGKKWDGIKRKLIDNSIKNSGIPIDMIRIVAKKSKQGDILSRTIEDVDTIEVILPALKDIPMRRLIKDGQSYTIDSLSVQELFPLEIYAPASSILDVDDLLFRVLYDERNSNENPYVMCLEIKDLFATFGHFNKLWEKYSAVYFDGNLPQAVVDVIIETTERRIILGF